MAGTPTRKWAIILGAAVLLVWGVSWAWQSVRPRIFNAPRFRLAADDIEITAPPKWIKTDVKAEALRDASLDESLSILDDELPERVEKAFLLHPWVARVVRVTRRSPARLMVELEYRRPVLMVEVPGGLFPVDAQGILLPTEDFTPAVAARYPRLSGTRPVTEGLPGTLWRDDHVRAAARIAAVLADDWKSLGLSRIVTLDERDNDSESNEPQFELLTRAGQKIRWGKPLADGAAGQKEAKRRLKRLKGLVPDGGHLDDFDLPANLNLDRPVPAPTARREAARQARAEHRDSP